MSLVDEKKKKTTVTWQCASCEFVGTELSCPNFCGCCGQRKDFKPVFELKFHNTLDAYTSDPVCYYGMFFQNKYLKESEGEGARVLLTAVNMKLIGSRTHHLPTGVMGALAASRPEPALVGFGTNVTTAKGKQVEVQVTIVDREGRLVNRKWVVKPKETYFAVVVAGDGWSFHRVSFKSTAEDDDIYLSNDLLFFAVNSPYSPSSSLDD